MISKDLPLPEAKSKTSAYKAHTTSSIYKKDQSFLFNNRGDQDRLDWEKIKNDLGGMEKIERKKKVF